MTITDFRFYEQEVIGFVNGLLDRVKAKSFSDYVLLLSRASYQKENEHTSLSPYVIQSNLEIRQDQSRQNFLHTYLNQFTALLKDGIFLTNEMQEFNCNLQLMIYSHIWESHRFLMNLKRIASIINDKGYAWRIPFDRTQNKGSQKMIPINKGKFIQDEILKPLHAFDNDIGKFMSYLYDSKIRNGYAHSLYYINMENHCIEFLKAETYSLEKAIPISDWEQMFCYTVLFSYHLTNLIVERLNHFIEDYPAVKEVEILWPSYERQGYAYKTCIHPKKLEYQGHDFVEFSFSYTSN